LTRTRILLASSNPGKVREIKAYFAGLPVLIFSLDSVHPQTLFPETAGTFRENARGKSLFYSQYTGALTLAEDSGLEIEYLGGAPGVFSARFSGRDANDEKNIRKVLRLLKDVSLPKRRARFVSHLVLSRKGRIIKETHGEVGGFISLKKKGAGGFGYDPVFFYPPFRKTLAEVPADKKNAVSHRGRALRKMKEFLEDYLGRGMITAR
jgi:XTP/dITP diphosphohydrolase